VPRVSKNATTPLISARRERKVYVQNDFPLPMHADSAKPYQTGRTPRRKLENSGEVENALSSKQGDSWGGDKMLTRLISTAAVK